MINIIFFNLKRQLRSILFYLGALVGFAWMYIGLFPSMQKIDIQAMMSQMPKEFVGFLGEDGAAAYNTIEGFLSGEFYSFFFVLLIAFYVASTAGSAIAGGIEKRTLDFDLSQPVSRTKRLLAEGATTLFYSFSLIALTNFLVWILCQAYNIDINSRGLIYLSIVGILFGWATYGIAILLSSLLKSKLAVSGLAVFLILASYIFFSLSLAVEKIKEFGKYTLYNFYEPQKILGKAEISLEQCLVLGGIFLIGFLLALLVFNKKDI